MSDVVSFGNNIFFPARAATVDTIFAYLRQHAPDHPEFQQLLDRAKEFDYVGGWSFESLSADALRILQRMVDDMAADLPAAAAAGRWNDEWKPVFYADVERFRSKLEERIRQLD
jgi:hypothetical protein